MNLGFFSNEPHELHPVFDPQLLVNVIEVRFDRAPADEQLLLDGTVALPVEDELDNLSLPW